MEFIGFFIIGFIGFIVGAACKSKKPRKRQKEPMGLFILLCLELKTLSAEQWISNFHTFKPRQYKTCLDIINEIGDNVDKVNDIVAIMKTRSKQREMP